MADPGEPAPQPFAGTDFRRTLGSFPTGVTVITTRGEGHEYGMTATAFSSVSLDPPLVLVCVITKNDGAELIPANGIFAVNVLSLEQEPISSYFASKSRPRGQDAFSEVPHRREATGAPIIEGAAAFMDCRLVSTHEEGDHLIFIGEVAALGFDEDAAPLIFHGGGYRRLTS